jgi:hypothetical protein
MEALWELMFLNRFSRQFLQRVRAEGMVTPDGCLGVAATGVLDEDLFHSILQNLPDGTWEFVTHPGITIPIWIESRPGSETRARWNCVCLPRLQAVKIFRAMESS